ncbi:VOC family protein [Alginatibacterium sediminis]|uniref:VOC family protein n=1 Tax=Alginatibacterium sediminis TaxID=2164068 RepID=A0A420E866_9ALTE|nr:VOC family protein [Alginatibacterium sediminis]RKF15611.1 VOC family protein [Alginatibacterium sediminis]
MHQDKSINYLEFASKDLDKTKAFFHTVFNWIFTDYGPEYTAFKSTTMEGGFYAAEVSSTTATGACLVVFYAKSLLETQQAIVTAGGIISQEIFSFPGGFRFHFIDPTGNEFAVWSEQQA